jgi:hypothetical protein
MQRSKGSSIRSPRRTREKRRRNIKAARDEAAQSKATLPQDALTMGNSISTRFRVVARMLEAIAAQVPISVPRERPTRFPSGRA